VQAVMGHNRAASSATHVPARDIMRS